MKLHKFYNEFMKGFNNIFLYRLLKLDNNVPY